jgi:hypothetical protein
MGMMQLAAISGITTIELACSEQSSVGDIGAAPSGRNSDGAPLLFACPADPRSRLGTALQSPGIWLLRLPTGELVHTADCSANDIRFALKLVCFLLPG